MAQAEERKQKEADTFMLARSTANCEISNVVDENEAQEMHLKESVLPTNLVYIKVALDLYLLQVHNKYADVLSDVNAL